MRGEPWEYYPWPYNKGHRKGILKAEQEGSHLQTRGPLMRTESVGTFILDLQPPKLASVSELINI